MQRKYSLSADLLKISVYSFKNILYIDSRYYLLPYKNLIIFIGKLKKYYKKKVQKEDKENPNTRGSDIYRLHLISLSIAANVPRNEETPTRHHVQYTQPILITPEQDSFLCKSNNKLSGQLFLH